MKAVMFTIDPKRERKEDILSLRGSTCMPLYGPDPVPTYEGPLFIWNTRKMTRTTHAAESMRIGLATAILTASGDTTAALRIVEERDSRQSLELSF
jgi:hypothetical protein